MPHNMFASLLKQISLFLGGLTRCNKTNQRKEEKKKKDSANETPNHIFPALSPFIVQDPHSPGRDGEDWPRPCMVVYNSTHHF